MIKLSAATRGKFTSFFKLFARSTVVKLHQEIKTRICFFFFSIVTKVEREQAIAV